MWSPLNVILPYPTLKALYLVLLPFAQNSSRVPASLLFYTVSLCLRARCLGRQMKMFGNQLSHRLHSFWLSNNVWQWMSDFWLRLVAHRSRLWEWSLESQIESSGGPQSSRLGHRRQKETGGPDSWSRFSVDFLALGVTPVSFGPSFSHLLLDQLICKQLPALVIQSMGIRHVCFLNGSLYIMVKLHTS